jgi:Ca2+-transporting ATPase
VGLLVGGLTIGMQAWSIRQGLPHWQTMAFTVLCFSQLGLALAIRSRRESLFSLGLLSNKPMLGAVALTMALHLLIIYVPFCNALFSTQRLTVAELGITLALSSLVFWAVELQKLLSRRRVPTPAPLPVPAARPLPKSAALVPA